MSISELCCLEWTFFYFIYIIIMSLIAVVIYKRVLIHMAYLTTQMMVCFFFITILKLGFILLWFSAQRLRMIPGYGVVLLICTTLCMGAAVHSACPYLKYATFSCFIGDTGLVQKVMHFRFILYTAG